MSLQPCGGRLLVPGYKRVFGFLSIDSDNNWLNLVVHLLCKRYFIDSLLIFTTKIGSRYYYYFHFPHEKNRGMEKSCNLPKATQLENGGNQDPNPGNLSPAPRNLTTMIKLRNKQREDMLTKT